MARGKIKIKKIENMTARQATFLKRRRGLFKKAEELSILCDAEVAILIFAGSGKFFEYSTSSMDSTIARYTNLHENDDQPIQPQVCGQIRSRPNEVQFTKDLLRKITADIIGGGRFNSVEELQKMEETLQGGLGRVLRTREEKIMKEFSILQKKESKLIEENKQLQNNLFEAAKRNMHNVKNSSNLTKPDSTHTNNVTASHNESSVELELHL